MELLINPRREGSGQLNNRYKFLRKSVNETCRDRATGTSIGR